MPETTHMLMWIMSDRTLPRSFAIMEGFGIHTFRFVNTEGESTYVKFQWKPKAELASTIWDEAKPLLDKAGVEPDEGAVALDDFVDAAKRRYWDREPKVRASPDPPARRSPRSTPRPGP